MLKTNKAKSKIFHYNFLEKNRKASHVGMILSFVVFITFLVFIFSILQPAFNEKKDKTTVLDYISSNIVELISGNFSIMTIEVNTSKYKNEECFKIISEEGIKTYSVVKNLTEDAQKTIGFPIKNSVSVEPANNKENLFKIYSSEEIIIPKEGFVSQNCVLLNEGSLETGYEIKSVRENEYPFLTKAIKMGINLSLTNQTHKELGQRLKVPPGTEFSIQLINSTGAEILGKRLDLNTEVYTREMSIGYVDLNGNIKQGKIRINVA